MQVLSSSPSPRLAGSPSVSPRFYRRASNGSQSLAHPEPSSSSSRSPTVLSRRPAAKSPIIRQRTSPLATRPSYTYKDAATQYSPMSPMGGHKTLLLDPKPLEPRKAAAEPSVQLSTTDSSRDLAIATIATAEVVEDTSPDDTTAEKSERAKTAVDGAVEEPPEPGLKARMPSAKRPTLESQDSVSPSVASHLKRVRSGQKELKVLPERYELCPVHDLVVLIANMLSELIETNDPLPLRNGVLTRFHSRAPPGISVFDYLNRLAKHATLTPPLLLSMVYYIDKLCSMYPAFTINTLTVHRFLITAATVAAKGLSDAFWNNSTYARVGGLKLAELGLLELEFLHRVDWRIVPNPEVLVDYYQGLVERSEEYILESDADRRAGSSSEGDAGQDTLSSPE